MRKKKNTPTSSAEPPAEPIVLCTFDQYIGDTGRVSCFEEYAANHNVRRVGTPRIMKCKKCLRECLCVQVTDAPFQHKKRRARK